MELHLHKFLNNAFGGTKQSRVFLATNCANQRELRIYMEAIDWCFCCQENLIK